ncbi:MAG: GGDEF domain-containing protein, partial [Bdellovibrionaceae bacterium]|nr:GGDEF domain-containing protein [Pseudobdellovibrionaceae bacterium]
VCLIALDIDHFKKINDCYGHDIGDFVLVECVKILKEIFNRESDLVARVGGEEFAILLPEHRLDQAVRRGEELLSRIRREALVTGNLEIRFTLSLGVAQLLPDEDVSQWTKRADEALYQSKNSGRDRLTVASHPLKKVPAHF